VHGRVEGPAVVVATRVAEVGHDADRLRQHGTDTLDHGVGVGRRVLERPLQVVQDGQPAGCHGRPFLLAAADHVARAPLAEVVQLGSRPPPRVLQLRDLARLVDAFGCVVDMLRGFVRRSLVASCPVRRGLGRRCLVVGHGRQ